MRLIPFVIIIIFMSATMDVQTSTALISSDSVAVECFFLTGSQSKGCHVEIYFTDNSTISRNISRFSDYSFVGNDIRFSNNKIFEDIFVYDWEKDGSIGTLSVQVDIMRTTPAGLGVPTTGNLVPTSTVTDLEINVRCSSYLQ